MQKNVGAPFVEEEAKTSFHSRGLLCFDALNFTHRFFTSKNFWDLETPRQEIRWFTDSLVKQGWDLQVFIDSAVQGEE